jgi:hypothetical protein
VLLAANEANVRICDIQIETLEVVNDPDRKAIRLKLTLKTKIANLNSMVEIMARSSDFIQIHTSVFEDQQVTMGTALKHVKGHSD